MGGHVGWVGMVEILQIPVGEGQVNVLQVRGRSRQKIHPVLGSNVLPIRCQQLFTNVLTPVLTAKCQR